MTACILRLHPQAEKDALAKKAAAAQQQSQEAAELQAGAAARAQAAEAQQARLSSEVDRLGAMLHSHSVRLET